MGSVLMRMEKFIGRLHLRLLSAHFGEFFWAARIAEKDLFTENFFFLKGGGVGWWESWENWWQYLEKCVRDSSCLLTPPRYRLLGSGDKCEEGRQSKRCASLAALCDVCRDSGERKKDGDGVKSKHIIASRHRLSPLLSPFFPSRGSLSPVSHRQNLSETKDHDSFWVWS